MKKVAICGIGSSLVDLDFDDDIEIWGLNQYYASFKRWDLWFDVHRDDIQEKHITRVNYPYEEAFLLKGKQFNSSISYMIAYAILKGYEQIELYGVDFNDSEKRLNQKECCLRWIDFAKGRGIKILVASSSKLNREEFLYGVV